MVSEDIDPGSRESVRRSWTTGLRAVTYVPIYTHTSFSLSSSALCSRPSSLAISRLSDLYTARTAKHPPTSGFYLASYLFSSADVRIYQILIATAGPFSAVLLDITFG